MQGTMNIKFKKKKKYVFVYYLINRTIFGKKSYWSKYMCCDFLYNFYLKYFLL